MRSAGPQPRAWLDIDVMLLSLGTVVGLCAWAGASVGVGFAQTANAELAWLNVAVTGLIVFGAACALWLLRGRRAVGVRRLALVRLAAPAPQPVVDDLSPLGSSAPEPGLVRVVGSRLVHRAGCPLVARKPVEPGVEARDAGAPSCLVCTP